MLTKENLQEKLLNNIGIQDRLKTLRLAEELNPDFKDPHIVGGYLRNILLDAAPNDCDVVFKGYQLNQPGILEAIRESEKQLNIDPYPEWEVENMSATGYSGDFYEDAIGKYCAHTDYLTLLLLDSSGNLYMSDDKTLTNYEKRVYDLRFIGIDMWAKHRAKDRSYASCLIGDLIRAAYLGQALNLDHTEITKILLRNFDTVFNSLDIADQEARQNFWLKKTKGNKFYQPILDRFGITTLKIIA